MAKIENVFLTTMALASALLLTGCPGACLEDNPSYFFDITSSFIPDADSVRVGDTIFYQSEISSTLPPRGGGDPVKYTNGQLSGGIYILEYPAGQQRRRAANDFLYIKDKGEYSQNGDWGRQFKYGEITGGYEVSIGIVPQKKGRYVFLVDRSNDIGKCDGAYFGISLMNDQQKNRAMAETWAGGPGFIYDQIYAVTVY